MSEQNQERRPGKYGETLLHRAIIKDNLADVRTSLANNANPNQRVGAARNAIQADNKEEPQIFRMSQLPQRQLTAAVPNMAATSLHLAACNERQDAQIVDALLSSGAQADVQAVYRKRDGFSHTTFPVNHAILHGSHLKIISALLSHHSAPNINARDASGFTSLHYAAMTGNVDAAQMLIDRGADLQKPTRQHNESALILAVRNGHANVVKMLLTTMSTPGPKRLRAAERTAIFTAALLVAIEKGEHDENLEIVNALLAAGANPNHQDAENGDTPLHKAAHLQKAQFVTALIEGGAGIEAKNKAGFTPLLTAATNTKQNPETVLTLLAHGANKKATAPIKDWVVRERGLEFLTSSSPKLSALLKNPKNLEEALQPVQENIDANKQKAHAHRLARHTAAHHAELQVIQATATLPVSYNSWDEFNQTVLQSMQRKINPLGENHPLKKAIQKIQPQAGDTTLQTLASYLAVMSSLITNLADQHIVRQVSNIRADLRSALNPDPPQQHDEAKADEHNGTPTPAVADQSPPVRPPSPSTTPGTFFSDTSTTTRLQSLIDGTQNAGGNVTFDSVGNLEL